MYSRIKYAVRTVWDPGRHAVIVGTRSPIPLDSVAGLNGNRGGRECSPTALPDCHDCRGRTSEMGNHNKHKNQKRIQRPVCKRYFHNRNVKGSSILVEAPNSVKLFRTRRRMVPDQVVALSWRGRKESRSDVYSFALIPYAKALEPVMHFAPDTKWCAAAGGVMEISRWWSATEPLRQLPYP